MVIAKSSDSAGAAIDTKIAALTANVAAQAGLATYAIAQQALAQAQAEAVRHYTSTGQIHPAAALAAAGPVIALTGVAITNTAGAFSCTAPARPLAVGQSVKLSGTYGGTGSITGYTNPTTYAISATNGSTTFTLTTAAGAAIVTTAGTPTGISYALTTPLTVSDLPNTVAGNAIFGAQGSNLSARLTALTTAAAGGGQYTASQAMAGQQLHDAQTELLFELFKLGVTTPALVLANLS
jgi:hypothetical protein